MSKPIYLDYNATTPIAPQVAEAMLPYLYGVFGNPSSAHSYGLEARQALERSRGQVAALLNAQPEEITFTSGGTESNNLALRGLARGHIITSMVEHPAVLQVCEHLEHQGIKLTRLPVDERGLVDPEDLRVALRPETSLVSIMLANNEVGSIQPIRALAKITHAAGALFHTDAAQAVGKIPVDVRELGVDLLSVAGHKLYGPKGVGALYVRAKLELPPLLLGGGHERGVRPGTENVLLLVGLGAACALAQEKLLEEGARLEGLRDQLEEALRARLGERLRLNGDREYRLPNTLNLSIRGLAADTLLAEIADEVAASAGSACHTGEEIEISPVLQAMAVPMEWAMGTLRLSLGRGSCAEEIERAAEIISAAALRMLPSDQLRPYSEEPSEEIRLTRFTHGLGCACKLRPQDLARLLKRLPPATHLDLLSGIGEDAAVWRIRPDLALIQTLDFFSPIVDSPREFGAIAAANALSDIYAMGGTPISALNILGFPVGRLPLVVMEEILLGAAEKAKEAGVVLVGGHSIDNPEPIFGLSVLGQVHPEQLWRKGGGQPGDWLILTKPLGLGLISTAVKQGLAPSGSLEAALSWMQKLNAQAAALAQEFPVSACTDITGFGLLGHLKEMIEGNGLSARLQLSAIPSLLGVEECIQAGAIPGGSLNNLRHVSSQLDPGPSSEAQRLLLADAQTSGGLLLALPPKAAILYLERLESEGAFGVSIGSLEVGDERIVLEI